METQETQIILRVDSGEAIQSVADLKENIQLLKEKVAEAEGKDLKAYNEAVKELKTNQNALKDAMYGGATSFEQLSKDAKGVGESYNSLVHKMADLKKNLRATDVSTEEGRATFNDYARQIAEVNDKLKSMDAQQGNFQRNVGNYAGSIASISGLFGQAGNKAKAAIDGVKGMTAGLKAMSATPAIAILTALTALFQKVTDGLKSSEANMEKMTVAFAPFQAGGDAVTKVIQKMGEGLGKLAEGFTKVLDKMGLYTEKMKERKALAEEEIALLHAQRDANRETAEDELKIAELRAQAADKINNSAEERLAKLKEASALEEAISQRNYELAKKEYEIIKAKNALTDSSTEELNKENEAYIKMTKAQTAYYAKQRELNAQITEATTQMSKQRLTALKKEQDEAALLRKNLLSTYAEGSLEALQVQRDNALKELNEVIRNGKQLVEENGQLIEESQASYDARYLAQRKVFWSADKALQAARLKESTAGIRLAMEERKNDKEAQLAGELQLAEIYYDNLAKLETETESDFVIRREQANNDIKAKTQALLDYQLAQEKLAMENRLSLLDENSLEYANAAIAIKKWEVDQILLEGKREAETEEEYQARKIAAEKAYTEARETLIEKQIAMAQAAAGATADIFGAIADIIDENNENNEKAFRFSKALRIAEATINTISGAIGAFMQANATYPYPAGQIIGGIQAAAVTAAGVANISKIRNTTLDSSSSGTSATTASSSTSNASTTDIKEIVNTTKAPDTEVINAQVSAPSVTPSVSNVRNASTASDREERKEDAKAQKVYILSSDIEASQSSTKVRVSEASF